ncbi:MAG: hypothetical protein ABEJ70_08180 [Halobacteriaceae archaeon]
MLSEDYGHRPSSDRSPAQVALLSPLMDPGEQACCADLLALSVTPETHLLGTAVTETPDELVDLWREYVGPELVPHSATAVVATPAGETGESTTRSPNRGVPITVRTVRPDDLTGVGIAVSDVLDRHADRPLSVCVRGIGPLLMYHDESRVYRFLREMLARFREREAAVHVHLHDEAEDVSRFLGLFDATLDVRDR